MNPSEEIKKSSIWNREKLIILCLSYGSDLIPDRECLPSGRVGEELGLLKNIQGKVENNIVWLRKSDTRLLLSKKPLILEYIKLLFYNFFHDCFSAGKYWGYPSCCCKKFCKYSKEHGLKVRENMLKASMELKAPVIIFSWVPCSVKCKKTKKIGKEIIKLCKKHDFYDLLKKCVEKGVNDELVFQAGDLLRRYVEGAKKYITDYEISFANRIIKKYCEDEVVDEMIKFIEEILSSENTELVNDMKKKIKKEINNDLSSRLKKKFGIKKHDKVVERIERII